MTLIIAIQAKDSIIISADKRIIYAENEDTNSSSFHSDKCKLHLWEKGIIAGGGELEITSQMHQWLQQNQDIFLLPKKLNDIKKKRTIEVGQHDQITHSSIIVSTKEEDIPQLYSIGLDKELEKLEPNNIIVKYPITHIFSSESIQELKRLSTAIKDYGQFTSNQNWINHYLNQLSSIYKKQGLSCEKISTDFHVFFNLIHIALLYI